MAKLLRPVEGLDGAAEGPGVIVAYPGEAPVWDDLVELGTV